jgi:purine-binding chemotaxis protein CheW
MSTDSTSYDTTYLLLRLGNEQYALPSGFVREIARWREPTPVPGAPPIIPGIINQRGVVLPVIQLGRLLGFAEASSGRTTRYLIASYEDAEMALLIDEVIDLVDLADAAREQVPVSLNPQQARMLTAITWRNEQPVGLLNLGEIITIVRGET